MSAARPREAAGSCGSRRRRFGRERGALRPQWAWPAALVLVALGIHLSRMGNDAETEDGHEVLGLLGRLDRMALVYVSALADAPDRSFFLDRYEVTNDEFSRFLAASGYEPEDDAGFFLHLGGTRWASARELAKSGQAGRPVVHVSLDDAQAYARFRRKEIPTAAEWALAARGTDAGGPFALNAAEAGLHGPARVGSFESARTRMNAFIGPSVYDLLGNVWEWTVTPSTSHPGTVLVKGGSFLESARRMSPSPSRHEEPTNRNFALGFRCVVRNAERVVREILEGLAGEPKEVRAEVVRRLRRFGEPLRRLLARSRFEDRVRWSAGRGLSVEHVVSLPNGRVVLGGFDGAVRVIEGHTGAVLGRRDDLGRIDEIVAADLDGDQAAELYVVAAPATPEWPLEVTSRPSFDEDVRAPEFFLVRDGFRVRLVDPVSGEVIPWMEGPLEDVERRALDLRLDRASPRPPAPLLWSDVERHGWFHGYVPRERRRLLRLDPASAAVETVWERSVPLVEELLPLPATGELIVACAYRRRFVFDPDVDSPEPFNRILDLRVMDAAGNDVAEAVLPGGTASIAALDERGRRLVLVTYTGHEVIVERVGGRFVADLLRDTGRSYYVDRVVAGPAPFAASLLMVEVDDEERRPLAATLEGYDGSGRRIAAEPVPLVDGSPPKRFRAEGSDATLLLWPDATIVCLDAAFRERWRRARATDVALERGGPVALDFDRDGRVEFCVPWRLDGFLRLDADSGRVLDGFQNPNALVFSLHRQTGPERDRLLATVADLGVLSFGPIRTDVDDEARRLIEDLAEPAPRDESARGAP